ncbi:unnamed protein product [Ranitomeya imitator]|uniref:Uncharacterized protein n=1 Tax=Ranitomeya imitator TaxID=111125 RepID=A0ABN9M552_9NEOB|nr:unnamed protein product [Ranitomeya imitator]
MELRGDEDGDQPRRAAVKSPSKNSLKNALKNLIKSSSKWPPFALMTALHTLGILLMSFKR